MSRPALEVADIFRGHGAAWRQSQRRPCEPRPAEGDVGDRELPHGGARRPCRALRGLRAHAHRLQLLPQPALPEVPGRGGASEWLADARGRAAAGAATSTSSSPCRRAIADIAYQNKAVVYDLLFKAAAETLHHDRRRSQAPRRPTSASPRCCTPGAQALTHHPHVHCIVPGGGISPDGERWVACRPGFFLPVRVLSRLFRRLFLEKLARRARRPASLQLLRRSRRTSPTRDAFAAYLAPLRKIEWVVYAKRPFGGPEAVLAYLVALHPPRRHLQQPADRLDDNGVTFRWKDYRAKGRERYKVMTLAHRRVHPPLPAPRPARRLPPHPPLRPVRQRQPRGQYRTRPRVARGAVSPERTRDVRSSNRRTAACCCVHVPAAVAA